MRWRKRQRMKMVERGSQKGDKISWIAQCRVKKRKLRKRKTVRRRMISEKLALSLAQVSKSHFQ
jgi:hypothetical protein